MASALPPGFRPASSERKPWIGSFTPQTGNLTLQTNHFRDFTSTTPFRWFTMGHDQKCNSLDRRLAKFLPGQKVFLPNEAR
jgi:hypothetical protein